MQVPSEVADLVALGLTHYEAKGYVGLLGREHATPTEVARIAGVPRQRSYDVLANLAERGLIVSVPGKVVRYRANPPELVVERLVALRRAEVERQQHLGRQLTERLTPLFAMGQDEDGPLDYVEVLRDGEHAAQRIGQLLGGARECVLGLVRSPYHAPPAASEARVTEANVQRAIYEQSMLDDPAMNELIRAFADLGEEVRIAADLPLKLMVIDGLSVAFSLPDPVGGTPSETTLIVHHRMLASTLELAFEAVWSAARPLAEALEAG